jgi:hypothetical protein
VPVLLQLLGEFRGIQLPMVPAGACAAAERTLPGCWLEAATPLCAFRGTARPSRFWCRDRQRYYACIGSSFKRSINQSYLEARDDHTPSSGAA